LGLGHLANCQGVGANSCASESRFPWDSCMDTVTAAVPGWMGEYCNQSSLQCPGLTAARVIETESSRS